MIDVLAQGTTETVIQGLSAVGIMAVFGRWLMAKSDRDSNAYREDLARMEANGRAAIADRNKVIEEIARESLAVSRESVKTMQAMTDKIGTLEKTISEAPCGAHRND